MAAVSGAAGLKPALAAVDRGATVALANKECLVCAGDFFMQRAAKAGACILPADSEHNALFQALGSGNREELVRVIITASGGPFRTWTSADIEQATLAQALKHPNWSMGQKITINSASMMNKGLEVIEASYLFNLNRTRSTSWFIRNRSSMAWSNFRTVPWWRNSVRRICARRSRIAWAGPIESSGPAAKLDLAKIGQLTFEAPDFERFPGTSAGLRGVANWQWRDHRLQCGERGRGCCFHRAARSALAPSHDWSRRRWKLGFAPAI